jgi:hypothetical protein
VGSEFSAWSNTASATTNDIPPAEPTGLNATAVSDSQINLNWVDQAGNEDGYRLEWILAGGNWNQIPDLPANTTSYSHTGLSASTGYAYRVFAFNQEGDSPGSTSAEAVTDDPPPFVEYVAQGQSNSEGSVSGSYTNTHDDDSSVQSITEQQSGGNPRKRRSSLSHTWTFNIVAGNSTTLTANAWSNGSSDGDDFLFAYSTDGSNWSNAFVVSSTSTGNTQSAGLPGGISGTVYVRVTDTDNSQSNSATDTVSVDQLVILVDNTPVTPPAAPSGLGASAIAYNQIDLVWSDNASDETGYRVTRSTGSGYSVVATLGSNANSYSDTTVVELTSYSYLVVALKGATVSSPSNFASTTTPAEPTGGAILLSASGFKVKGKQQVDLSWSGSSASNVDIKRDGSLIATISNDGFYSDNIGAKGGATYQYELCDAGTSNCSSTVTVIF